MEKSVLPIYSVGIVVLGYGLCFPLNSLSRFFTAALAAGAVYLILWAFLPQRVVYRSHTTDNYFSSEGRELSHRLKTAAECICDIQIRRKIYRIEEACQRLFAWGDAHADQRDKLRLFISFYLPSAIKLTEEYSQLEGEKGGANIRTSMKKISDMLDTLGGAFEKLYDDLFFSRAVDISAEITVLQELMRQHRLIDNH